MNVAALLNDKRPDVETVGPDATVLEITQRLTERKIGSVLVVDDGGAILGIVSERDVVRCIANEGAGVLEAPASRIMTREVVTCQREDSISYIMEEMTKGRFRHVPVVEGAVLVGIVSIGDVVKHRIAEAEHEASAMQRYIAAG